MQTLTVVGVEDDYLIVVSDEGERFRIPLTDSLYDAVKRPAGSKVHSAKRVSPKDIQAHFRRGLSAQQVSDLTGETTDYVALFEGPVLAERQFIVDQARLITFGSAQADKDAVGTFGEAVANRLEDIHARDISWSSWKEESGWMVEVSFFEGEVEHRALWSFDARKHILTPQNQDATTLSQDQPIQGPLIPKLRPVSATEEHPEGDRFDTEIFQDMPLNETGPLTEPVAYGRNSGPAATTQSIDEDNSNNTADLLEALRRRRGEREPAPEFEEDPRSSHPSTGSIRLVHDDEDDQPGASVHHLPFGTDETVDHEETGDDTPSPKHASRKYRPEMPSWDDIVFGARPDEDPA
jgi:hypothetical protein